MEKNPASFWAVLFNVIDGLLLIVFGVLVTEITKWWSIPALLIIILALTISRYVAATEARIEAQRAWLAAFLEDPSDLEDVIRGITSHGLEGWWNRREMEEAIEWWYQEDLQSEWQMSQEIAGIRNGSAQPLRARLRRNLRHPGWTIRRMLTKMGKHVSGVSSWPLLDAVAVLELREVSRLVLRAGVDAGFLKQETRPGKPGHGTIRYRSLLPPYDLSLSS